MTDTETKVRPGLRPLSINHAVFRNPEDLQWYWTLHETFRPVGPFKTREEARNDFRHVTAGQRK